MIDAKNAILIVFVLVVLGIVGLYIPYNQYSGQQPNFDPVAEGPIARVLYMNRGFEPDVLTIETGTTVEWVNESDKLMWVASDDHPSHMKLPGFDQKGSEGNVAPPQSFVPVAYAHDGRVEIFRYTFTKPGTWAYHNHLVPADRGVVEVR